MDRKEITETKERPDEISFLYFDCKKAFRNSRISHSAGSSLR